MAVMRTMALLMIAAKAKVRAEVVTMAGVRAAALATTALRAVGGDCRGVANGGGNCCCKGSNIDDNSGGGGSSGNGNGCGDVGSGCGDGDGGGKVTAMAVLLSAASSGGGGTTTDACNAILPR